MPFFFLEMSPRMAGNYLKPVIIFSLKSGESFA